MRRIINNVVSLASLLAFRLSRLLSRRSPRASTDPCSALSAAAAICPGPLDERAARLLSLADVAARQHAELSMLARAIDPHPGRVAASTTALVRALTDGRDNVRDDVLTDRPPNRPDVSGGAGSPRPCVSEVFTPHGSSLCDASGRALVRVGP